MTAGAAESVGAAAVARRYFSAIARRDLDEAIAYSQPGAIDRLAPVGELRAPDGLRAYFGALFQATMLRLLSAGNTALALLARRSSGR